MSQVLTVPTHFNDLGELSEGFLDRVEQDTLILYGPVAYEDGSEIEFVVLLADGSPALEGAGRVRAAVDGGADRVPETRYDVVVEALQLDGRSEVVFERLVLARQAVSDRPPADDAEPPTGNMDVAPSDEDAPDTVPPEASDDEGDYDDDPATVIALVDAQAMMAEAEADVETAAETAAETETETETETAAESASVPESVPAAESASVPESVPASEPVLASEPVSASEPAPELEFGEEQDVAVDAAISEAPEWDAEPSVGLSSDEDAALEQEESGFDSEYAFEQGRAAEPQVGMPVPIPSMAAPPEAPPAPPTLRLAEPPEGLTRPSLAQVEESLFSADGEVSDVHTTGLFVYENGLPIPSRPPLPDLNRPRSAAPVEAADGYDVEESEPPEGNDDEYEEVRLSDFAEAAEEG
jgi:hypothetical protein